MPLSYSQLSTYRRCPKQYEYAVIKKVPRAISQAESFGSSIHNTLKKWGELELKHQPKTEPSGKRQLALFTEDDAGHKADLTLTTLLTLWRISFIAEGYTSRAERDARILHGEAALTHFFDWWKQKSRTVVSIEQSFKLAVPGVDDLILSGRFDRIERTENGLSIIDFKTSGPREQKDIDCDLQLSVYALAAGDLYGEPVAELALLCLSEDGVTEQNTTRSASELNDALTSIRLLGERITSKDFTATPSIEKCRSCPYREICPARAI